MAPEDLTTRAADLAERILDEVSSANQDWGAVARCARELADLAGRVAAGRSETDVGNRGKE